MPNQYDMLREVDETFGNIIPFGWGIFGWISKGVVVPFFGYLEGLGLGYGLIIFVMALFFKGILSPLTFASYKSMAKMRVLKPEMDAIAEKYPDKGDSKKQQETMALYQKTGVNPLGGCLPQLLGLPILIALFRFFPASFELRQQGFLWADDLSSYDSIMELPMTIPFYGDHVSLFTILMAISTFMYTKMNNQMSAGSTAGNNMMQQQMKVIQYLMPVMLLVWFNSYSSGLSYYYFLSNILVFGQQWAIRKFFINEDAIRAKIEVTKSKGGRKSKFASKMESMMEQQTEGNRRTRRMK
jgi:YidC/Oxa1 family membrane protein insertase